MQINVKNVVISGYAALIITTTVLFIVLRIANVIHWGWGWVLLPFWGGNALAIIVIFILYMRHAKENMQS